MRNQLWSVARAAADPSAPAWLNTGAVVGLMLLAISLVGGLLGVRMMTTAHKGDVKKQASMAASAFIGLSVFLAFTGGVAVAIATGSLDFLVNSGAARP